MAEEEEEVAEEEAGESLILEEALEVALLLNYRDCAQPWVKTYVPMERKDQQIKLRQLKRRFSNTLVSNMEMISAHKC